MTSRWPTSASTSDPGSEPDRKAEASAALLDTPSLLAILGAYYQRLVQGGRFDVARKAFQLIHDETSNPALKEFCAGRLNQLSLVGKPAPPIQGTDVDGKPLNLADLKGNVVLVVFWASWCLPNAAEIAWLDEIYETYRHGDSASWGSTWTPSRAVTRSSRWSCPTSGAS